MRKTTCFRWLSAGAAAVVALLAVASSASAQSSPASCEDRNAKAEERIAACTALIRSDPTRPGSYIHRGKALLDRGEHERATQDFDEAIERDPGSGEAYANRSILFERMGQHDRAEQDTEKAFQLGMRYSLPYEYHGRMYVRRTL